MGLWSFSQVGLSLKLDLFVVGFLVEREVWVTLSVVMGVGPSALGSTFLAPPVLLSIHNASVNWCAVHGLLQLTFLWLFVLPGGLWLSGEFLLGEWFLVFSIAVVV